MVESEPISNIQPLCDKHVKELFPKGKFTSKDLAIKGYAKAKFGRELMWFEILSFDEIYVTGIINNEPVLESSPKYGENVIVNIKDIVEIWKD